MVLSIDVELGALGWGCLLSIDMPSCESQLDYFMATIAEFSVPVEQFALQATLEQCPDLEFEVDRVVANEAGDVSPFVWVSGEGLADLPSALEADPSIEDVELLTEREEEHFYQLKWADKAQIVSYMLSECDATVQRALATHGVWELRVLFPDHSEVSKVGDFAQEHGLDLELKRVYSIDDVRRVRFNLTESQNEALAEAYNQGYYKIPREQDAAELADTLGISHQALSERLRRGTENLVENALIIDEEDD